MSDLHLLRIPIDAPRLLRFAQAHGITQEDESLGYTLHAWLSALFGEQAPKPFRYFERRNEVLGYARTEASVLLEHAQSFAAPLAWQALDAAGVASKPMPTTWHEAQRLHVEVLTCPTSRKEDDEKDVYLRTLDRLGDGAPSRAEVYRQWFIAQWGDCLQFDSLELLGMQSRARLLRRDRHSGNRLRGVERPQALFGGNAVIRGGERFAALLARGIGRHRAFGFGMVLLSPPR